MDEKLSGREKELNDIKGKCVQNEETLDGSEKEIIRLRKEREFNEVEMKNKVMLINIREKESNELMRQKDTKIEEHVEAVTTLKMRNLG